MYKTNLLGGDHDVLRTVSHVTQSTLIRRGVERVLCRENTLIIERTLCVLLNP